MIRTVTVRGICLIALAWVIAGGAGPGLAAERLKAVQFRNFNAVYELLSGYQFERYEFPDSSSEGRESHALLVGERLGLNAGGSFVSPMFWLWDAGANMLLLQKYADSTDSTRRLNNSIGGEYSIASRLMPRHPYPIHVYARRRTNIVRKAFVQNYEMTTSTIGGDTGWRNAILPIRISASQTTNEFGASAIDPGDEVFSQASADVRHEAERHTASLEYRLYDYQNLDFSNLDYRTHDITTFHFWYPGTAKSRPYRLNTRLRYGHRASMIDRQDANLTSTFTARLAPRLESRSQYRFTAQSGAGATSVQNMLLLDLRYQLYESLFFGVTGQGMATNFENGNRFQAAGGGEFTYRKRVLGIFAMSHSYRFQASREVGDATMAQQPVVNETHTLFGTEPVILLERDVNMTSVMVVDASTSREYLVNIDYELRTEADRVILARLPTGQILDGASVLVSYDFGLTGGASWTVYDHRYIGRVNSIFTRYLTLFGEVSERWNDSRRDDTPDRLDRYEVLSLGATGSYKIWQAEMEARRYKTLSFGSTEYRTGMSVSPRFERFSPTVGLRFIVQDFSGGAERRKVFESYTEGSFSVTNELTGIWRLRFLAQDAGSTDGKFVDSNLTARWRLNAITIQLDYRVRATIQSTQQYQLHSVFVSVGRTL